MHRKAALRALLGLTQYHLLRLEIYHLMVVHPALSNKVFRQEASSPFLEQIQNYLFLKEH